MANAITWSVIRKNTAASADMASTSPVVISEIFYNSPGSDRGSNQSLNAEWVKLRNRTVGLER